MTRLDVGVPAVGVRHGQDFKSLTFRFLVAIDVEGFSQRHTAEQARVQEDLEYAMRQAGADAGLDPKRWYRQPRGDGELAVLPAGADGLSLVADYPAKLASAIAALNKAGKGRPRLRARIAIHHGAVTPGRLGPVGDAPIVISRLVDAEVVRQQLRQSANTDIVLIVSSIVYDEVIQSRLRGLCPEAFRRTLIRAKGMTYTGYLCRDILASRDHASSLGRGRILWKVSLPTRPTPIPLRHGCPVGVAWARNPVHAGRLTSAGGAVRGLSSCRRDWSGYRC